MSQTYDESKWAKAAAAAKDVIDLGRYELHTADYQDKGDNTYPATVKPPYNAKYSNKNFPDGWANIDPFESYRSIFNGDLSTCRRSFRHGQYFENCSFEFHSINRVYFSQR